jgi:iron complex transport system substrate-binding protein
LSVANGRGWTQSGKRLSASAGQPWSWWNGRTRYSQLGNWGPELVEIANGELLLGEKGKHSAAIPVEQLRDADPEYLIVAPCGFDLVRSLQEQAVLERYPWWCELQAVRKGNVAFADGNLLFNRSGMTVSQTAEVIAEILHGVSFGGRTEGVHWRRIETLAKGDSQRETMIRS